MNKYELAELIGAIERSLVAVPGRFLSPVGGLSLFRIFNTIKFKINSYRLCTYYFKPCGTIVFCGSQGEGKTLTAVNYVKSILKTYTKAILVTNTRIKGRPVNAYISHTTIPQKQLKEMYDGVKQSRRVAFYKDIVETLKEDFYDIQYPTVSEEEYIKQNLPFYYFNETDDLEAYRQEQEYQLRDILTDELITTEKILAGTFKNVTVQYTGLDCLKYVNNEKAGVIFFIDEIHLELNSLESKNIPVEVMVEISQQRKQRKHIVGTSQRYIRMAKPLREHVRDIVAYKCYFGVIQYNKLIDGDSTHEVNGDLAYDIRRRMLWFHSPEMYKAYDTYAKMRRYNNVWQGRSQMFSINGGVPDE